MRIAGLLHTLAIGGWLGVVAAEVVLEVMRSRNKALRAPVARLHFYIDIYVEKPLILLAAGSGAWLLWKLPVPPSGWLQVKIIAGGIGMTLNMLGIWQVVMRHNATNDADDAAVERADKIIIGTGLAAVPCVLLALGIALVKP